MIKLVIRLDIKSIFKSIHLDPGRKSLCENFSILLHKVIGGILVYKMKFRMAELLKPFSFFFFMSNYKWILEEVLFWNPCHSFNPNSFKHASIKTPMDSNFLITAIKHLQG